MKRIIFLIIFIILISGVSAQNISFSYPEEVHVGEEFTVKVGLTNFSGENYDIKFDTSESGSNLLEVLNNGQWRSNYYYVIVAISNNEEKEFTLKVREYIGTIIIMIKTRLSGTKSVDSFGNYEIESLGAPQEETEEISEPQQDEETKSETSSSDKQSSSKKEVAYEPLAEEAPSSIKLETITLNPKVIKTENNNEEITKNYAFYGFVAFSVFLGVLFIIRKNRYKNEFR